MNHISRLYGSSPQLTWMRVCSPVLLQHQNSDGQFEVYELAKCSLESWLNIRHDVK